MTRDFSMECFLFRVPFTISREKMPNSNMEKASNAAEVRVVSIDITVYYSMKIKIPLQTL